MAGCARRTPCGPDRATHAAGRTARRAIRHHRLNATSSGQPQVTEVRPRREVVQMQHVWLQVIEQCLEARHLGRVATIDGGACQLAWMASSTCTGRPRTCERPCVPFPRGPRRWRRAPHSRSCASSAPGGGYRPPSPRGPRRDRERGRCRTRSGLARLMNKDSRARQPPAGRLRNWA